VLDFTQPVAPMLLAVLHLIPDEDKPADIVATLLNALPPGSYLVASHGTPERSPSAGRDGKPPSRVAG
jgi:S-adenosyl methyltransferase